MVHSTGIVLGGGGARGAYEAGVVAGIAEVMRGRHSGPLFDVICGTSVGAINAAYLAACSDHPDHDVDGLVAHWAALDLKRHLSVDVMGLLGVRGFLNRRKTAPGRSLLAIGALQDLVGDGTPWDRLRANISEGRIRGLIVTALEIESGRTTVFTDLPPGVVYPSSLDPRRVAVQAEITADHVLASAAIPLIFPPRRVQGRYYVDGGLRFNTPLAPALRLGAQRIVVIPLLTEHPSQPRERTSLGAIFLLGKLLDALLLDPISYDLHVLERFNRLLDTLDESLTEQEMGRVQATVSENRGAPYRRVDTLVFRPTHDLGALARERARALGGKGITEHVVSRIAAMEDYWEADLLSFILFDGVHAKHLVDLGRADVVARADEVRKFFEGC